MNYLKNMLSIEKNLLACTCESKTRQILLFTANTHETMVLTYKKAGVDITKIKQSQAAGPTLTVLLRRTIRDHQRRSRPEQILNVFQRTRLRFFPACGLASGSASLASLRRQCRTGS